MVVLQGGITASTVTFAALGAINTGDSAALQGVLLSQAAIGFGANTIFTGMAYSYAALNLGSGTVMYTPPSCRNPSTGSCTSPCGNACPQPNSNAYRKSPTRMQIICGTQIFF